MINSIQDCCNGCNFFKTEDSRVYDCYIRLFDFQHVPEIKDYCDSLKELFIDLDPCNPVIAFTHESEHYHRLYNPVTKISNFIIQNFEMDSEPYTNWINYLTLVNDLPISIRRKDHPPTKVDFSRYIERLQNPDQDDPFCISVYDCSDADNMTALIPHIHRLFLEGVGHHWGDTLTKNLFQHEDSICVISSEGEHITGIALGAFLNIRVPNSQDKSLMDDYRCFHVCALITAPEVAGRKVGSTLLESLLFEANVDKVADYCTASISAANVACIRLFENEGFKMRNHHFNQVRGAKFYWAVRKHSDDYQNIGIKEVRDAMFTKGNETMGKLQTIFLNAQVIAKVVFNRFFF